MKNDKKVVCWVVELPGRCPAYVQADSWEQATVKAAEFWGVPWGRNVAHMTLQQKMESRKNVCLRCRRIFYEQGELCPACEHARRDDAANAAARMKKTWYMGRKDAAFGK